MVPDGEPAVGEAAAEEEEVELLHPASASASAVTTATAPGASSRPCAALGPVGRGPAGSGRLCSFVRLTWLPPIRHHAEGAGMRARETLSAFHLFVRIAVPTRPNPVARIRTPRIAP
ncbi:hypothetical protein GCM10010502_43290 [Kitasatospora aureofaciens]|uniref:Uncharacterized protein n=1 Tax=Kitasatospora aureofaciens TaxID=1894 RepID=A0A8H9HSX9_KITAU|nr:hypothetical protein GCM10010502_43290 [Kitasatospora aureofaciens]